MVEVLLVHRPRYDDWSFPKGKNEPDEDDEVCAGLGAELPPVAYVDHRGRPKVVRYWLMHVVEDRGFEPGDEVDEIRWVPVEVAEALLSYAHDVELLHAATSG